MATRLTDSDEVPTGRRDPGVSFIELLVAVVLLGTSVIAVLAALQATTVASRTDADHARAFAWLQAASDRVFEAPRIPCATYDGSGDEASPTNYISRRGTSADAPNSDPATATVWAMYKSAALSTPAPSGWAGASIELIGVEFLGRPNPDASFFEWGTAYCFEGVQPDGNGDGEPEDYRTKPLLSQKVTIRVTSPNGSLTKTIETVKSDR